MTDDLSYEAVSSYIRTHRAYRELRRLCASTADRDALEDIALTGKEWERVLTWSLELARKSGKAVEEAITLTVKDVCG